MRPSKYITIDCPDGTEQSALDVACLVLHRRGWATCDIEVRRGNTVIEFFPGLYLEEQLWLGTVERRHVNEP